MGIDSLKIAITLLAALAAAASVWGRLRPALAPPDLPAGPESFCIGLEHRRHEGGLSCAADAAAALLAGIHRLRLPPDCAAVDPPPTVRRGDLLVLDHVAGACRLVDQARLPGAQRLASGIGLDANRDSALELELLPGIGAVRARSIVESRERDGPFEYADQLSRVRGIGPRTVERLRPWLVWPARGRPHLKPKR